MKNGIKIFVLHTDRKLVSTRRYTVIKRVEVELNKLLYVAFSLRKDHFVGQHFFGKLQICSRNLQCKPSTIRKM